MSLTTTQPGSLVYGVGNDVDGAIARTLGANQTMMHEWGDAASTSTYWVQNYVGPVSNAGTLVQLNDTAPTNDRWNFAAVEIVAAPSIALSATTVPPGGTVTATIANGPGNAGDWVGLYAASDPDSTDLAWNYLNGSRIRPATGVTDATVAFTLPMTPGTYNVRFFLNDSTTRLAISATITVTVSQSSVTVSATTVSAGGTVTATVANGPGNAGDWVGLYVASDPESTYVAWSYLNGSRTRPATGVTSATLAFTLPMTPGTYNVRFFLNDSTTRLATSATITAPGLTLSATTVSTGATVTATIANGPANVGDWVGLYVASDPDSTYVAWNYLNGSRTRPATGVPGATLPFTMPTTPGTYNVRFFLNDSTTRLATSATITVTGTLPSVTVSATTMSAGGTVMATIANGPANVGDWVGLYATSAPNSTCLVWTYLNGSRTRPATGLAGATVPFTMPMTSGTYNVRFFLNDSTALLATSATITVP